MLILNTKDQQSSLLRHVIQLCETRECTCAPPPPRSPFPPARVCSSIAACARAGKRANVVHVREQRLVCHLLSRIHKWASFTSLLVDANTYTHTHSRVLRALGPSRLEFASVASSSAGVYKCLCVYRPAAFSCASLLKMPGAYAGARRFPRACPAAPPTDVYMTVGNFRGRRCTLYVLAQILLFINKLPFFFVF